MYWVKQAIRQTVDGKRREGNLQKKEASQWLPSVDHDSGGHHKGTSVGKQNATSAAATATASSTKCSQCIIGRKDGLGRTDAATATRQPAGRKPPPLPMPPRHEASMNVCSLVNMKFLFSLNSH